MSRAVLVLGMHRSGTSCLTGNLQEAGLFLGPVHEQNPANAKGNREHPKVMKINEAVLAANGAAWNDPPDPLHPLIWPAEQIAARDRIVAELARGGRIWGNKDPRTLLTLAGWQEAVPDAAYVASIRHPGAVAASLQARGHRRPEAFTQEACLGLWMAYNSRLLHLAETASVRIVSFDWSKERYLAAMTGVSNALDLSPPAGGFSFYDSSLRTNTADDTPLPPEVARLWARLSALAEQTEQAVT